jgi:hypothetical protein
MKLIYHFPFLFIFIFLVPEGSIMAKVSLVVESGFETNYSVEKTVDYPSRVEIRVSGSGTGELPDWDTDMWIDLDVVSSRACYSAVRAAWEANLAKRLSLSLSAGLEFEDSDTTLHAETWMYFNDYNPFYPGSPLQSNGAGNVDLSSHTLTPHMLVSLKWTVTNRISMGLDAGWGYSFASYDDFNFHSPMNQVFPGVDEIVSISSKSSYETQRWQIGASIGYVLSDRWTASVGYQFLFLEDLSLKNTVLSSTGDAFIYSLPLENRMSQRVTFSATYRF